MVIAGVFATMEAERPMPRRPFARAGMVVLAAVLALSSAACTKTTIKGRIDVPGHEGPAIAVRVIPEKEIADYLAKKVPEALAALDERRTTYERISRSADAAVREYQGAFNAGRAGSGERDGVRVVADADGSGGATYTYDTTKHTAAEAESIARGALLDVEKQGTASASRFAAEKSQLDADLAAGRDARDSASNWTIAWEKDMLADLPQKGTVVYADDKGAFTLKVPRGGKVAVFASGDFKTGNRTFHRGWGLWVKTDAAEKTVTLDGNNMLLSEPIDSVLR
jgi:hypothetical protein